MTGPLLGRKEAWTHLGPYVGFVASVALETAWVVAMMRWRG
ncbi:MAG: hypothetical protein ACOC8K_05655 [Gemmatimonadota bacterium]